MNYPVWADFRIGYDLHLQILQSRQGFSIAAADDGGTVLASLATTTEPPSDAILAAVRATALLLYPDRVEPAPAKVDHDRPITPHSYQRDRSQSGWKCKLCPLDPHDPIHSPPRKGAPS